MGGAACEWCWLLVEARLGGLGQVHSLWATRSLWLWLGWSLLGGATLAWCLLVTLDDEPVLSGGVLDDALLSVGVHVTVGSLDTSVIQTSLFSETLAGWTASSVIAELVVSFQRWADLDVVQFCLLGGQFGCLIGGRAWSCHRLRSNLAG